MKPIHYIYYDLREYEYLSSRIIYCREDLEPKEQSNYSYSRRIKEVTCKKCLKRYNK